MLLRDQAEKNQLEQALALDEHRLAATDMGLEAGNDALRFVIHRHVLRSPPAP